MVEHLDLLEGEKVQADYNRLDWRQEVITVTLGRMLVVAHGGGCVAGRRGGSEGCSV